MGRINGLEQLGGPYNAVHNEIWWQNSGTGSIRSSKEDKVETEWNGKNHFKGSYIHYQNRFPGSTHYDPDKITEGESKMSVNGATGESIINIPGFSRAWHDITIRPVNAKMLAIPIHREAYGKSPKQFDNLFGIRGKKVLFKNDNGTLVGMFALANSAFQP